MPSTSAIVLRTTPYSDAYNITSLYSSEWGVVAVQTSKGGVRRKSSTAGHWGRILQPLCLVEIESLQEPARGFIKPIEIRLAAESLTAISDPAHQALAFFLCEFTEAVVRAMPHEKSMYNYIYKSFCFFAKCSHSKTISNFHIAYILGMLNILGYMPFFERNSYPYGYGFDLKSGQFTPLQSGEFIVPPHEAAFLPLICKMNLANAHRFILNRQQRATIIHHLLNYCKLHHTGVGSIKSLSVLQQLFD